MNTTVDAKQLRNALATIKPATASWAPSRLVKLVANGDMLRLRATNGAIEIGDIVDAVTTEPGTTVVQYADLVAVLKGAKGDVEINTGTVGASQDAQHRALSIRTSALVAVLETTDPADFPPARSMGQKSFTWTYEGPALASAITRALVAVALDETRPVLCTVHVQLGKRLELTCTDGFRIMHDETCTLVGKSPTRKAVKPVLIHRTTMAALAKLAATSDVVRIAVDTVHQTIRVTPESGAWALVALLDQGPYPNCATIYPATYAHTATLDRDALLFHLRSLHDFTCRGLSRRRARSRPISTNSKLVATADALTLSASNGDETRALTMPIRGSSDWHIAIHNPYLIDACEHAGPEITVQLNKWDKAALFTLGEHTTALIMPMYAQWETKNAKKEQVTA